MIVIDSTEVALGYLLDGHQIAKVSMDYPGMATECLVAGVLKGLSRREWWYVLLSRPGGSSHGLVEKALFLRLYRLYYIQPSAIVAERERYYVANFECPVEEASRYRRRVDGWQESISTPTNDGTNHFG